MRNNIFIKESKIKHRIENFLYGGRNIEREFYILLSELGVRNGKYVLKNYNDEDGSFDCVNKNERYRIRLGSEFTDSWSHSTIEITYDDTSVNYFYYLNRDLIPSLKIRDISKEVNGKKFTEILNYSLDKNENNAYIRSFKEDNREVFFYLVDPELDPDELDLKVLDKDFHINWSSIYYLLENYGNFDKYLVYYKKDGNIVDLASYGFPIEEVLKHYESSNEQETTKVRIKNRKE